jgi:hypothetical protein
MIKLFLLLSTIVLVSCSAKPDNTPEEAVVDEAKLNRDAFEVLLETNTGVGQTYVETSYKTNGNYVIFKDANGVYTAYNINKFDRATMTVWDNYIANTGDTDIYANLRVEGYLYESGYWQPRFETVTGWNEYYDPTCDCNRVENYAYEVYVGDVWIDTSTWETNYYSTNGTMFENTNIASRDLEMHAAIREDQLRDVVTTQLQNQFALSADRAEELAELLQKYKKLESNRALTATEKDYFALETLGVSLSEAERALKEKAQGNNEAYENLLEEAAQVNSTTPETVGKFIETYIQ